MSVSFIVVMLSQEQISVTTYQIVNFKIFQFNVCQLNLSKSLKNSLFNYCQYFDSGFELSEVTFLDVFFNICCIYLYYLPCLKSGSFFMSVLFVVCEILKDV
jgi:hypothetical protein